MFVKLSVLSTENSITITLDDDVIVINQSELDMPIASLAILIGESLKYHPDAIIHLLKKGKRFIVMYFNSAYNSSLETSKTENTAQWN